MTHVYVWTVHHDREGESPRGVHATLEGAKSAAEAEHAIGGIPACDWTRGSRDGEWWLGDHVVRCTPIQP